MAFLGPESETAAQGAECAGEQGKFWPFYDLLNAQQPAGRNSGTYAAENLKKLAPQAGVDGASFASCLDSGHYLDKVRGETNVGRARGVTSTPTVFVNGQKTDATKSYEQLRDVVLAALRQPNR